MINYVGSQATNDCAITALATFCNEKYDDVIAELAMIMGDANWRPVKGTPCHAIKRYVERRGYQRVPTPRRGQDKLSGLVIVGNHNLTRTHAIVMLFGKVFDNAYPNGISLKEYAKVFSVGDRVREVYQSAGMR